MFLYDFKEYDMTTDQLTQAEIAALHTALDDEYLSWTTYDQVIRDFGEVRPFINIRDAEARHINALSRLYARYDVVMPENPYLGKVERFKTLYEACKAAVAGEIANGEIYEKLFEATSREDILIVLRNLQTASLERHLPAFQRCVARGEMGEGKDVTDSCGGKGQGGRRGGGRGRRSL